MPTTPLLVQEQITCLREVVYPSRAHTEPVHTPHMRTYLVKRVSFRMEAERCLLTASVGKDERRFTSDEDQTGRQP